jgi:hypothetical protein
MGVWRHSGYMGISYYEYRYTSFFCLMVVALDSNTTGFFHIRYDVIVDIWVYPGIRVYKYWVFCLMVVALDSHTTVFSYCVVRIINGEMCNYLWGIMWQLYNVVKNAGNNYCVLFLIILNVPINSKNNI